MTADQILEKIKTGITPATGLTNSLVTLIQEYCLVKDLQDIFKQYDPKAHAVTDPTRRKDKVKKMADGQSKTTPVSRMVLPVQKKIVLTAAAFLGTPSIEATSVDDSSDGFIDLINKIWDDNKLDWKFKQLAKRVMSEKHCAELWYTEKLEAGDDYWEGTAMRATAPFKFSVRLISPSSGDELLPVFDDFGKMVAFGRKYKTLDEEAKEIERFDIYTADTNYFSQRNATGWVTTTEANYFKKIPVIYYYQPYVEWEDVQTEIERLETKINNHADTNDYFDSPIVFATGGVEGFPDKGEAGKLLEGDVGADVKYLTWDQAPESTRMEIENLIKFIYQYTSTPDISFESMKGLGVFSGIALKMLFLDAHLKAADKAEIFGEGLQRRINFMKAALLVADNSLKAVSKIKMSPKFEYFLPQDTEALVTNLIAASGGKPIMSQETAVRNNPYVEDPDNELELIQGAGAGAVDPETGLPITTEGGGDPSDNIGKIPLAVQQLTLAATRAAESGDTTLVTQIKARISALLAKLVDAPAA